MYNSMYSNTSMSVSRVRTTSEASLMRMRIFSNSAYSAVQIVISFSTSITLIFFLFLFHCIPKAGWYTKKLVHETKRGWGQVTWTAIHRLGRSCVVQNWLFLLGSYVMRFACDFYVFLMIWNLQNFFSLKNFGGLLR